MNNFKYVLAILGINYPTLQAVDLMGLDEAQAETFYNFNSDDFTPPYEEEDPAILNDAINNSLDYKAPDPFASHDNPVMEGDYQEANNIVDAPLSIKSDIFPPIVFDEILILPMATEDPVQLPASNLPAELDLSNQSKQSLEQTFRKRKRSESMSEDPDYSPDDEAKRPAKRPRTQDKDTTGGRKLQILETCIQTLKIIQDLNFDANKTDDSEETKAYWDNAVITVQKKLFESEGKDVCIDALFARMNIIQKFFQLNPMEARIINRIGHVSNNRYRKEVKPSIDSKKKRARFIDIIKGYKTAGKFQEGCNYEEIVTQLITDHKTHTRKDFTGTGLRTKITQILETDEIPQEDRDIYTEIRKAAHRIYMRDRRANKNKNTDNKNS